MSLKEKDARMTIKAEQKQLAWDPKKKVRVKIEIETK